MRQTGPVTGTFQLSLRVRVACSVPLVLLAGVLAVGGIDTGGVWGPLGAVGAVFVLVIAWRSWQLRVDDLGDGVRIVNWTLTVEVPWDEIDRFEFDGRVSLRRRDLRTVPLSAFPLTWRNAASNCASLTGQERTPIASNECVAGAETHAAVRAI